MIDFSENNIIESVMNKSWKEANDAGRSYMYLGQVYEASKCLIQGDRKCLSINQIKCIRDP